MAYETKEERKRKLRRGLIDTEQENTEEEGQSSGSQDEEMERKIRKYRIRKSLIIFAVIAVFCLIAFFVYKSYRDRTFSEFEVKEKVDLAGMEGASYAAYRDGFIKYGTDGMSYVSNAGETIWSASYTMSNPMIEVCGDYAAAADRMGTQIVICGPDGMTGQAKTTLPLLNISVSENGAAAVILEDTAASYIDIYSSDGSKLDIEIKALLNESGYPMDVAISWGGTILAVPYVYISNGTLMNQMVFYNFDEEGKEFVNRVVGGFKTYNDVMIGDAEFVSDTMTAVFATDRLDFYSLKKSNEPTLAVSIPLSGEAESIAYGNGHEAVLMVSENGSSVEVYSSSGSENFKQEFDYTPDGMELCAEGVVLYSGNRMTVVDYSGKIRFDGELDSTIRYVQQVSMREYLIMSENGITRVLLK